MNGWAALRKQLSKSVGINSAALSGTGTHVAFLFTTILYAVVPTVLTVAAQVITTPWHKNWILEVTFLSIVGSYFALSEALKDIKVMLIFHELVTNFRQVHKRMLEGAQ